eukprot:CAMPEP_0201589744 /NCGR_PEP_ID=MMETSP0190_2-20130828/170218_1 /ASSEMBLY_ACC=CAM_ASM_000263 /TAXON_ID=37353 /ORGANISM="Rosalina sp." /LENGTH=97 /DNA_ID=CAMNT_0048044523 /DNA_START=36 /DNA_END=326 /DNA_ORIENTATION=-
MVVAEIDAEETKNEPDTPASARTGSGSSGLGSLNSRSIEADESLSELSGADNDDEVKRDMDEQKDNIIDEHADETWDRYDDLRLSDNEDEEDEEPET